MSYDTLPGRISCAPFATLVTLMILSSPQNVLPQKSPNNPITARCRQSPPVDVYHQGRPYSKSFFY